MKPNLTILTPSESVFYSFGYGLGSMQNDLGAWECQVFKLSTAGDQDFRLKRFACGLLGHEAWFPSSG